MKSEFLGPFIDAETALDALRRGAAEVLGEDQDTWPPHKNAPLAVVAALALWRGEISRLTAETENLHALERQEAANADILRRLVPLLEAAAAGAPVSIASGDLLRDVQARLASWDSFQP